MGGSVHRKEDETLSNQAIAQPSPFLAQVEFDLAIADKSDKAYSRLLRISKEIRALDQANPLIVRLTKLLAAIPPGIDCECCGFKGLVNVRRKGGHTVGPECFEHEFGSCKR